VAAVFQFCARELQTAGATELAARLARKAEEPGSVDPAELRT